jgi:hypothetical protein
MYKTHLTHSQKCIVTSLSIILYVEYHIREYKLGIYIQNHQENVFIFSTKGYMRLNNSMLGSCHSLIYIKKKKPFNQITFRIKM